MGKKVGPRIYDITIRYHVMTYIETDDGLNQLEILRVSTFSQIDALIAMRIWWQWKYRQRDTELDWFETMIEIYSLLRGDIYIYDSIDQFQIRDCGLRKFGGRY